MPQVVKAEVFQPRSLPCPPCFTPVISVEMLKNFCRELIARAELADKAKMLELIYYLVLTIGKAESNGLEIVDKISKMC